MFDDLMVGSYVRWLRAHGLAPGTIRRRRNELEAWARWCGDPLDPAAATPGAVMDMLDARGLSDPSRATVLVNLRAFYRWARLEADHPVDPTMRVPMPRVPRYLPRPLTETDTALAIAAATGRMRTMVGLAALGGLRCAEIAGLAWDHVDLVAGTMRVAGKGRRVRVVPIGPPLAELLDVVDRTADPVAPSRGGRHLAANTVSKLIADHLRGLGIDATAHQLRHRFATALYRAKPDLLIVARVLGHASTATTQGYAAVADADAAAAVAAMPAPGDALERLLGPAAGAARGWRIPGDVL